MAELGFKSYVRRKHQLIAEAVRERKLARAKKLLAWMKRNLVTTAKIFSDKKIFTVDQVHNQRNDCWLAVDREDMEFVCTMKHLQQIMILGILCSNGKRMPPIFFGKDKKCNTEVYYKILRYKVLPWLRCTYRRGNYVFQQDGAPAHKSIKVQNFLASFFSQFWPTGLWPPSSPDLNPFDFFWWSVIERKVNATSHPNLDSLKAMITEIWAAYPTNKIVDACHSFRSRVEAVVATEGLYIEH